MESPRVQAQKPGPDHRLREIPSRRQDLPAWTQEAIARPGLARLSGARGSHPQASRPLSSPAVGPESQAGGSGQLPGIAVLPIAASRAPRRSPPRHRAPANGSAAAAAATRPRPRRRSDRAAAAPARAPAFGAAAGGGVGAEAEAGEEAGLRPRPQARFRRARRGPWEAWPAGAGAAQPGTFRNCRRGRRRESPSRGGRSAESRVEAEPPPPPPNRSRSRPPRPLRAEAPQRGRPAGPPGPGNRPPWPPRPGSCMTLLLNLETMS